MCDWRVPLGEFITTSWALNKTKGLKLHLGEPSVRSATFSENLEINVIPGYILKNTEIYLKN